VVVLPRRETVAALGLLGVGLMWMVGRVGRFGHQFRGGGLRRRRRGDTL